MKESLRAQYGENKRLKAGDYDASLAARRCVQKIRRTARRKCGRSTTGRSGK
ncbi:MAG: hypothetical protein J6M06_02620 [Synergistaceae bacterium]|nr:hypothetical protein [Synergistaceae bacterium]